MLMSCNEGKRRRIEESPFGFPFEDVIRTPLNPVISFKLSEILDA